LHDITSRHLSESQLHHIAFHDGLTDLANRHCFHERLHVAVGRSRLNAEVRFAVMFLDLDRFKVVNDSLGHVAGNQLLRDVAQRLAECVWPQDLVARGVARCRPGHVRGEGCRARSGGSVRQQRWHCRAGPPGD
jgi:GGDEF domain-containing protein